MNERALDQLISVREAAQKCNRNAETVRRWIWSGKLPAEKLGNQLFIKKEALESYCREAAVIPYQAKPAKPVNNIKDNRISSSRTDLIKRMRQLREQIRSRVGDLDVDKTIETLRQERTDELMGLH